MCVSYVTAAHALCITLNIYVSNKTWCRSLKFLKAQIHGSNQKCLAIDFLRESLCRANKWKKKANVLLVVVFLMLLSVSSDALITNVYLFKLQVWWLT